MKKVRLFINFVLGSMIAAVGFTGCEHAQLVPEYGSPYIDTTNHVMYGVDPVVYDLPEDNTDSANE